MDITSVDLNSMGGIASNVLAGVASWLSIQQNLPKNQDKKRREDEDLALKGVSEALSETAEYLKSSRGKLLTEGLRIDSPTEVRLSKLWKTAATEWREVDADFAKICDLKSSYWRDQSNWTEEQVERSGIAIKQIQERIQHFISTRK